MRRHQANLDANKGAPRMKPRTTVPTPHSLYICLVLMCTSAVGLVGVRPAVAADSEAAKAAAVEAASCKTVRLSDIGWTDVTATTAILGRLLTDLGYESRITVLSLPVTYAAMKNKDIDVFLGNWMPSQEADRAPFVADHSVDVIGANLTGAKYTLAVPAYTYEAGLRDFADIQRFGTALNHSIYGIEPGNDGNRLVLGIIKENAFGLGAFKLVESSEQGMLAEVERAFRARRPIVFLGWDPHPMNMRFDMRYLAGGDATFGPNFGGAAVFTNVRAGFTTECPNLGRLLGNLKFTPKSESEMMGAILDHREPPDIAAKTWLRAHPETLAQWLDGVHTFDGRPALVALVNTGTLVSRRTLQSWITDHKIPVGDGAAVAIEFVKKHGTVFFDAISAGVRAPVDGVTAALTKIPALILIGAIAVLTWILRRSFGLAAFVAVALLFILNQGYWAETLETLSLVMVAAFLATALGVPLGIAAAHRPRLYTVMRPVLDLMQTLPTFVYLIPALVLFGLGVVPGVISTVIFAMPAPIRLTHLGISSVPSALREAGEAFGATRLQLLWKVELPSAAPSIIAGITQCIMLSLSMVVIAALVGAGGLGVPVVRALNSVQVGMGFEAGFAIVLLAIVLDRLSRPTDRGGSR
jgi:glycine betaine/proline transport system substrate-binding protein